MANRSYGAAVGAESTRFLPGEGSFRGVDLSSGASSVARTRLAYAENMYRDYHSEQGGAVETVPGFRRIFDLGETVYGAWRYEDPDGEEYLAVHAGGALRLCRLRDEAVLTLSTPISPTPSLAFSNGSRFYLLDGTDYFVLTKQEGRFSLDRVFGRAYVPTVMRHGKEAEQYNMLSDSVGIESLATEGAVYKAYTVHDGNSGAFGRYSGRSAFVSVDQLFDNFNYNAFADTEARVIYTANRMVRWGEDSPDGRVHTLVVDGKRDGATIMNTLPLAALENICFLSTEGGKISFLDAPPFSPHRAYRISYGKEKREMAELFSDPARAMAMLPPNLVIRPGQVLRTGIRATLAPPKSEDDYNNARRDAYDEIARSAYVTPFSENELPYSELIRVFSQDGEVYVACGGAVPLSSSEEMGGENHYLLAGIATQEGAEYLMLRIYVAGSEEDVVASTDVTGCDLRPILIEAPTDATAVLEAYAAGEHAVAAEMRDSDGELTGVVVLAVPDGREIGLRLHIRELTAPSLAGHPTFKGGNPDYTGGAYAAIAGCTMVAQYDGRIFLAGNPRLPNTVFYSASDDAGVADPTYFGVLDFFNDSADGGAVMGLMVTHSVLAVFKRNRILYHTARTGEGLVSRRYPCTEGGGGIGCIAPKSLCNFRDDPLFLSPAGVVGIGKESVLLERTLRCRSAMVNTALLAEEARESAEAVEWDGWYCLFVDGRVYMADSRAMYTDAMGEHQYEWFYLTGIGAHHNDHPVYRSVTGAVTVEGEPVYMGECLIGNDTVKHRIFISDEDLFFCEDENDVNYSPVYRGYLYRADGTRIGEEQHLYAFSGGTAYLVEQTEERRGGVFEAAHYPTAVGDRLFFAVRNQIYTFNTDRRGVAYTTTYGTESVTEPVAPDRIHRSFYSFAGHAIGSVLATALDDCGAPHLTKSTSKYSMVIRAKVMDASAFSVNVYTDRRAAWEAVELRSNTSLNFYNDDFTNQTLQVADDAIYVSSEKEKRWVEKQYLLRDGGWCRPFGIYSLAYRYTIAGRIKG